MGDTGDVGTNIFRSSRGAVATITIIRPNKLNSLNSHILSQLPRIFSILANENEDLVCIVLTGAGTKAFIGGADITEMSRLTDPAAARAFITKVHFACESIRNCPVPVIARVNGFALGAGLEIAAACDMRVASTNAKLGMPEVKMGVPSVVEAALLPGLIGWGRTRMLLLLGELVDATQGLQWGLVEEVVPPEELDRAVAEWIRSLETGGRKAVKNQKDLIRKWEYMGLDPGIRAGIDNFGMAFEPYSTSGDMGEQSEVKRETEPGKMMGDFLTKQNARRGAKL